MFLVKSKSLSVMHQSMRISRMMSKCHNLRSPLIPFRSLSTTVNPEKVESKNPQSKSETQEEAAESGFNIFEQLKAQQNQKMDQEDPELNEKEKERIKRQQESAEREINEKQAKTFGAGSMIFALGSIALYAFLGKLNSNDPLIYL